MRFDDHWKVCPVCNKGHYILDPDVYVYKRPSKDGMLYFCKWSCMRKWDKENDPGESIRPEHDWEKYHTCLDCKFYHDVPRRCDRGITSHPYPNLDACSSFRELPPENSPWRKGQAKFTDSDIREIKRLYKHEYMTQQAIADRFGVSRSYIVQILER